MLRSLAQNVTNITSVASRISAPASLRFFNSPTIAKPSFNIVPIEKRMRCKAVMEHKNKSYPLSLSANPKIEMVAFDGGGTLVDRFCTAPLLAFIEAFYMTYKILIDLALAQEPMGRDKKEHIRYLLKKLKDMPEWTNKFGARIPTEADVEAVYQNYLKIEPTYVEAHSIPVEGAVETVEELRRRNIIVCLHTAYRGKAVEALRRQAKRHGLEFKDNEVATADDLINKSTGLMMDQSRPYGGLIRYLAKTHNINPCYILGLGDSLVDGPAFVDASAWGAAIPGTGMRLTEELAKNMTAAQIEVRANNAEKELEDSGVHYTIRKIKQTVELIDHTNRLMAIEKRSPTCDYWLNVPTDRNTPGGYI